MSSSSDIPQSARPSASEAPQDALVLFDLHLRFLTDSYLSFFQERRRIEEIYVDSLTKLHGKARATDAYLDERGDPTTTRAAWAEIRDNVGREADTRRAFLSSLVADVVTPLVSFRETQDRIRKRIKEDLKDAVTAHADYAENVLPRMKRLYLRKCQDVEDYKSVQPSAPPLSPTNSNDTHNFIAPKPAAPRTSQNSSTRPVVTSPQPLRPLDRRPSTSAASSRARSPSSSTAFQDLAHSGKRQLNQLMTFLDKGGNKDSLGKSDNALRAVRAKREADEADREYRKGIHWLETLRLRRVKIIESGYKSLEAFIGETASTVKDVLRRYTDYMTATCMTNAQVCEHGRRAVDRISVQKDTGLLSARIPRLLAAATPKPVFYYNYNVGECKDLIFGVTLVDYATTRALPEGEVPKIIKLCVKEVQKRGLDAEGIYRVSGRHAAVQELQHKAERNEAAFAFNPTHDDVYAVSSLLKLYLRELPEPVFRFPLAERLQHSEDIDEHTSNDFALLRAKMRRLPPIHQAVLKMIVEHLAHIASNQEKNKMDSKNLAIVFGSVIFGEDEMPKGGDLLSVQPWKDTLMEDLIINAPILFQSSDSPQLPPAPLGTDPAPITYGSSYTKSTNMPPPPSPRHPPEQALFSPPSPRRTASSVPSSPRHTPASLHTALSPEDFTPRLPPRPADSIHPSLRAGVSGQPIRQSLQLPPSSRAALLFDDQMFNSALPPTPREQSTERSRSRSRESRGSPAPSLTLPLPSPSMPIPRSPHPPSSFSTDVPTIIDSQEDHAEPTLRAVETESKPEEIEHPSPAPSSSAATFESAPSSAMASRSTSPSPAITEPKLPLPDVASTKPLGPAAPDVSLPSDAPH